jgi:hypothetical protein
MRPGKQQIHNAANAAEQVSSRPESDPVSSYEGRPCDLGICNHYYRDCSGRHHPADSVQKPSLVARAGSCTALQHFNPLVYVPGVYSMLWLHAISMFYLLLLLLVRSQLLPEYLHYPIKKANYLPAFIIRQCL